MRTNTSNISWRLLPLLFIVGWVCQAVGTNPDRPPAQAPCQDQHENKTVVIRQIEFSGNHKTRHSVLSRELPISEGDTITLTQLLEQAEVSTQNLLKTTLFNFAESHIEFPDSIHADLTFSVVERWYTWPIPIVEIRERNLTDWVESPSTSKMNYGISLGVGNITGRNEQVTLLVKTGYKHSYALSYRSPWFNKSQSLLWSVETGMDMSRESVYLTQKNKQLTFKDNKFVERKQYVQGSMTYRPGIDIRHRFYVGFTEYAYADTLTMLNPRFVPGERSRFQFMNLGYDLVIDKRDSRAYPLDGSYLVASLRRLGMGLFETERMDVTTLQGSYRQYLGLMPRWYAGGSMMLKWSEGSTLSYFNQQGLGFANNLVRGYENYVIDAQSFVVMKANLKYELIPQKNTHLSFIPTEKFSYIHYALYLNLFTDAGYTFDKYFYRQNPLSNKLLAGLGLGLDFVTYYDRVFRLECTMNRHGEAGVFFHVLAPF